MTRHDYEGISDNPDMHLVIDKKYLEDSTVVLQSLLVPQTIEELY